MLLWSFLPQNFRILRFLEKTNPRCDITLLSSLRFEAYLPHDLQLYAHVFQAAEQEHGLLTGKIDTKEFANFFRA